MSNKTKSMVPKKKHSLYDWKLTLLAVPFVLHTIIFKYVPLAGWALAFTNYRPGRKLKNLEFVGLKYFKLIGYYWDDVSNALTNTLVLSFLGIVTGWITIVFAICLNEVTNSKLRKTIQTLTTLPHFIGWVIVYSFAFTLLASDGMINDLLINMGVIEKPILFLTNADLSWPLMIFIGYWKGLGWGAIVYLAAIAGIDSSLYEAVRIDGGGRLACALHVTVPGILPTYIVLLILDIASMLSLGIDKYLMFSNSVTMSKLEVLDVFTYRIGIMTQDFSFATAVSVLKSIVSIILITFANMAAKKIRGEGII